MAGCVLLPLKTEQNANRITQNVMIINGVVQNAFSTVIVTPTLTGGLTDLRGVSSDNTLWRYSDN